MKQHGKKLLALNLALALVLGATLGISAPIVQAEETAGNVEINEENFPDANFRAYVKTLPGAEDGKFTPEELAGITEIDCSGHGKSENEKISDLTGIARFPALVDLVCAENRLTALDIGRNTALEYLDCSDNQLTSLDLSQNTALDMLLCAKNQLTSLDVSQNTALIVLSLFDNQVATLDVSHNTGLGLLDSSENQLTALDVTNNAALVLLGCAKNQLTTLDVSNNTALAGLECWGNQLSTLDVSKNSALEYLDCSESQLTSLDITKNIALSELLCYHNQLTSLDVTKNTALEFLNCSDNQLTSLNLSQNTALTELYCWDNQRSVADGSTLLDLDANFDISKVSNLEGGSFEGGKVHFTADQLTYTYDLGNREIETFTMVKSGKVPEPQPTEPEDYENPFTDLKKDEYYVTPVLWAVNKGITVGTSETAFSPDNTCTRAQIATFLWRNAGKPAPKGGNNPFTDVPSGEYFYDAVLWAVENGITAGTTPTTFGPSEGCTRAQVATFLWRAAGKPATQNSENPFTDVPANEYYYNAVLWAVEKGITVGTSKTEFSPEDTCTRAQIVTFLYRSEH